MIPPDAIEQVRREVHAAIEETGLPDAYSDLLRRGLAGETKLLSERPSGRWPQLVLGSCACASGGTWDHAVPAAAALEVFVAGLDLLDDVQDGDANPLVESAGLARALNVSTGLIMLGGHLILRSTRHGVPTEVAVAIGRELTEAALTVGGGQELDIAYEAEPAVDESAALDVASRKSATLVRCACRIGARLGRDEPAIVDALGEFGWHVGMRAQLLNDLADAAPRHPPKTDLLRGKKTLPAVVATTFGLPPDWSSEPNGDLEALRARLADSGALHYTWVVAELHRQQAATILEQLSPDYPTQSLLALVRPS